MTDKQRIIGELAIVALKARDLPNREVVGKQDPFCVFRLGEAAKRTKTDHRGGQRPLWNDQVKIPVPENTTKLLVQVFDEDMARHDLISEGEVDFSKALRTGEDYGWHPLKFKGKPAGEIYLEITFYAAQPPPKCQPTRYVKHGQQGQQRLAYNNTHPSTLQVPPTSRAVAPPLPKENDPCPPIYVPPKNAKGQEQMAIPHMPTRLDEDTTADATPAPPYLPPRKGQPRPENNQRHSSAYQQGQVSSQQPASLGQQKGCPKEAPNRQPNVQQRNYPSGQQGYPPSQQQAHPPDKQERHSFHPQHAHSSDQQQNQPPKYPQGYPPSQQPGCPPNQQSGYPPILQPECPPHPQPGYPPREEHIYPPRQLQGYPPRQLRNYPRPPTQSALYPPATSFAHLPSGSALETSHRANDTDHISSRGAPQPPPHRIPQHPSRLDFPPLHTVGNNPAYPYQAAYANNAAPPDAQPYYRDFAPNGQHFASAQPPYPPVDAMPWQPVLTNYGVPPVGGYPPQYR